MCLRPTAAQSLVPHSMMIEFVIWYALSLVELSFYHMVAHRTCDRPAWRDQLIIYEQSQPQRLLEVMADLEKHVELKFQASANTNTSVEDTLNEAVSNPKNWRLGDKFFHHHPQWKGKFDKQE